MCSWRCLALPLALGPRVGQKQKPHQQKLDRLLAMEVDCAERPCLMGSLEEGLTMPLPIGSPRRARWRMQILILILILGRKRQ